jgi:nucleotide-binding universal stress UspA family protein
MITKKSHKLTGSFEGALAGGGDPATSPLYVFGPFLQLVVASGVASVVFGAAIWLAVLTVVMVSGVYRLVMGWITDGTGGSGLNEEEFGGWAVMLNSAITVIEYGLTFLVSIAALVTFLADRFPVLARSFLGVSLETFVAVAASLIVGFAVNFGPKVAARTFGPATAAVLLLLWAMIAATIWRLGLHFPSLDLAAFSRANVGVTLGGYARILALMTGIEIFANLVAAYDGPARVRSQKAFGSLVIVMSTTALTMLIVGPAIYAVSDPNKLEVSVFTQTMDRLLPAPLPYVGTLIGVAVLLSAAAASVQGIQNLAVGLRYRHYVSPWFGEKNRYGVAANPVWLAVGVCIMCLVVLGNHEDTYLALYAAGVFVLLSLTAWATVKRLVRELRKAPSARSAGSVAVTVIAALLTSGATFVIFAERFTSGAWLYFVLIPLLYFVFARFRSRLGPPRSIDNHLGKVIASSNLPSTLGEALYAGVSYQGILVPLDQTPPAELALAQAQTMARNYGGVIRLLTVLEGAAGAVAAADEEQAQIYLDDVGEDLSAAGYRFATDIRRGAAADVIGEQASAEGTDLVVMSTQGRSRIRRWLTSHVPTEVLYQTTPPILLIRPTDDWRSTRTRFQRILVALDGSEIAEQVLPHVHELACKFGGEVTLLSVAEGSDDDDHADKLQKYLARVAESLAPKDVAAKVRVVEDESPAHAILRICREERVDLVMMVSHGRGGLERQDAVKLGSVVESVIQDTPCPVFLVSGRPPNGTAAEKKAG